MLKTEESRIAIVILMTFALLLLTGIYPQYVLWATVAVIGIIIALCIYAVLTRKKGEPQDERTRQCSLIASRNGFIVAIVLLTLIAAAIRLGAPYSLVDMVQIVWGLSIMTYFLSYLYCKRVA